MQLKLKLSWWGTGPTRLHCKYATDLVLGKAPGPDVLTTYIFKHGASEIASILQMLFTQSLNTSTLPEDWLTTI